jgi:hypothetical protein
MRPPTDRHARKRPFAGWMKRLANLKPSSSESQKNATQTKKAAAKNNPYAQHPALQGELHLGRTGHLGTAARPRHEQQVDGA